MAEIDVLKEKINYLKVWLGIFVVTLIGLIGWIVSNYEKTLLMGRLGFSLVCSALVVYIDSSFKQKYT